MSIDAASGWLLPTLAVVPALAFLIYWLLARRAETPPAAARAENPDLVPASDRPKRASPSAAKMLAWLLFDTEDRLDRGTFVISTVLLNVALGVLLRVAAGFRPNPGEGPAGLIITLSLIVIGALVYLLGKYAVYAKRCNDAGISKAWFVLFFVPLLGSLLFLYLAAAPAESRSRAA